MRVGEQLRLAETAKQIVSAPPALIRLAALATFPEGKVWCAFRAAVHTKAAASNLREGQAPPLRYG